MLLRLAHQCSGWAELIRKGAGDCSSSKQWYNDEEYNTLLVHCPLTCGVCTLPPPSAPPSNLSSSVGGGILLVLLPMVGIPLAMYGVVQRKRRLEFTRGGMRLDGRESELFDQEEVHVVADLSTISADRLEEVMEMAADSSTGTDSTCSDDEKRRLSREGARPTRPTQAAVIMDGVAPSRDAGDMD